jgi:hypothetical protein
MTHLEPGPRRLPAPVAWQPSAAVEAIRLYMSVSQSSPDPAATPFTSLSWLVTKHRRASGYSLGTWRTPNVFVVTKTCVADSSLKAGTCSIIGRRRSDHLFDGRAFGPSPREARPTLCRRVHHEGFSAFPIGRSVDVKRRRRSRHRAWQPVDRRRPRHPALQHAVYSNLLTFLYSFRRHCNSAPVDRLGRNDYVYRTESQSAKMRSDRKRLQTA